MVNFLGISIVSVLVVVMSIMPKVVYNAITVAFSMRKFGIRKIRRYNSKTDTLANCMIALFLLFSIFYCFIPFYQVIYGVLYVFSYLCVLAQANRVTSRKSAGMARTVILLTNVFAGIGFLSALGFLNNHISVGVINQLMIDIHSRAAFGILYVLQNRTWTYLFFQGLLFMFPVFILWSHFKYMRLENSAKAVYFITYIIKMLFMIVLVILASRYIFQFLDFVYQVDALKKVV